MTNPFVFIVGCPRSGTTLLQRIVNAHPQVAIIPEIGWIPRRYEDRAYVTAAGHIRPALIQDLMQKGGLGRYTRLPLSRHELEELLAASGQRPVAYADLIASIFDRYGEAQGKPLVGNKTVDYVRAISTLHTLWPQAKFVHLVRDGRDVCLSVVQWRRAEKLARGFTTWGEDQVSTAALWWEWQVRLGREAGNALGDTLYFELRYESLTTHPAEACAALCAFLGIPYDAAMLEFHNGRERSEPGLDAKHAWLPPTPGLRDWRTQMPPEEVMRFEAVAAEVLGELGYPRGATHLSTESLERAARLRRVFEGRPLPQCWPMPAAAGH